MWCISYKWSYCWIQFVIIYCHFLFSNTGDLSFGSYSTTNVLLTLGRALASSGLPFPCQCSELCGLQRARLSDLHDSTSELNIRSPEPMLIRVEQLTFPLPPSWFAVCPTELGGAIQPSCRFWEVTVIRGGKREGSVLGFPCIPSLTWKVPVLPP